MALGLGKGPSREEAFALFSLSAFLQKSFLYAFSNQKFSNFLPVSVLMYFAVKTEFLKFLHWCFALGLEMLIRLFLLKKKNKWI